MSLKLTASENGEMKPELQRYATKLRQMDKDGNGELDMSEVCGAIDELIKKEKETRMLKWILGALGLFSLLIVAATVGLTYAVVALSKDINVQGSAMVAKDTGAALETGANIRGIDDLLASVATSNDPAADLSHLVTISVEGGDLPDEELTVYRVVSASLLQGGAGIRVRTLNDTFDFYANETTTAEGGSRRLQGIGSASDFVPCLKQADAQEASCAKACATGSPDCPPGGCIIFQGMKNQCCSRASMTYDATKNTCVGAATGGKKKKRVYIQ